MLKIRKWYKKDPTLWNSTVIIAIVLLMVTCNSSDVSGDDKTTTEGYYGTERVKLVEKPVLAKTGTTVERGYIGTEYIRIARKQHSDGTQTARGWHGERYITTKTEKKNVEVD